jgi:hypothetical protein
LPWLGNFACDQDHVQRPFVKHSFVARIEAAARGGMSDAQASSEEAQPRENHDVCRHIDPAGCERTGILGLQSTDDSRKKTWPSQTVKTNWSRSRSMRVPVMNLFPA